MSDLTVILFTIGLTLLSVGLVGKWQQYRDTRSTMARAIDE